MHLNQENVFLKCQGLNIRHCCNQIEIKYACLSVEFKKHKVHIQFCLIICNGENSLFWHKTIQKQRLSSMPFIGLQLVF